MRPATVTLRHTPSDPVIVTFVPRDSVVMIRAEVVPATRRFRPAVVRLVAVAGLAVDGLAVEDVATLVR